MQYYLRDFTKGDSFPFFIQYGKHDDNFVMHSHEDFTELTIVLSGEAMHTVGQESFLVKQGDAFVLKKGVEHGYSQVHNFRLCNIMFQEENIMLKETDVFKTSGYQALFYVEPKYAGNPPFYSRLTLSKQGFAEIRNRIQEMIKEYAEKKEGYQTILTAEFLVLVTILCREYPLHQRKDDRDSEILVLAKAASYMEKHFSEIISVQQMADHSGYSRRHFTRLFSQVYHVSPSDYIISLRVEKAAKELIESSDSIVSILRKCGFVNESYFYRVFHRKMGETPDQYRKKRKTQKKKINE